MSRLIEGGTMVPGDGQGGLAMTVAVRAMGIDLLRAAASYDPPLGRKQRVRALLEGSMARRPGVIPAWLLRPVVVIAVLVGGAAAGWAALGHWPAWIDRAYLRIVPSANRAGTAPVATHEHRSPPRRVAMTSSPPSIAPVAEEAPLATTIAPIETPRRIDAPLVGHPRRPAVVPPGEDTAPVLAAVRALRLGHDPGRARVLLSAYLSRYPNGTLAEEALALSIEAATANADEAGARLLAQRYLHLYPSGPFGALARHSLTAASPPQQK